MKVEKYYHAACVLQRKNFVFGGKDEDGVAVKSIECYDTSLDKWSIVGNTNRELVGHALVTLNDMF